MINTYSNSLPPLPLPPPPVPPRIRSRVTQVMPPEPRGTGRYIRILTVAFLFHLLVSSGLFVYFFWRSSRTESSKNLLPNYDAFTMKSLQRCSEDGADQQSVLDCLKTNTVVSHGEGKVKSRLGPILSGGMGAVAHMRVEQSPDQQKLKTLQWNRDDSLMKYVKLVSESSALQILLPGYYYVYSQVTFTKTLPKTPLVQSILKRSESSGSIEEDLLLKAFCTKSKDPCTSFQGGIFRLEKGQKLAVNVTDLSLVNFDGSATSFGLLQLLQTPSQDM